MRVLLIILLVNGLVPGIGELVETLVHKLTTGHFAHAAGETHEHESPAGQEHGCGATAHRCGCCPSQPALIALAVKAPLEAPVLPADVFTRADLLGRDFARSLFRPPIARA